MPTHPIATELAPDHTWFRSSHSDAMQNCVEVAWIKSSYSDGMGNNCVEVAPLTPTQGIGIRDSKNPTGPALLVPPTAWSAFLTHARQ